MEHSSVSRRNFLKTTGTAAAAAGTLVGYATAPASAAGSNQKLRIGLIGVGRRGRSHIGALTN